MPDYPFWFAFRQVAKAYAASQRGLIFEYETRGNSRGVDISDFSMYPKEREFLYPVFHFEGLFGWCTRERERGREGEW